MSKFRKIVEKVLKEKEYYHNDNPDFKIGDIVFVGNDNIPGKVTGVHPKYEGILEVKFPKVYQKTTRDLGNGNAIDQDGYLIDKYGRRLESDPSYPPLKKFDNDIYWSSSYYRDYVLRPGTEEDMKKYLNELRGNMHKVIFGNFGK